MIEKREYDKILKVMIDEKDIADTPTIAKLSGKTIWQTHALLKLMNAWGYVDKLKRDKSYKKYNLGKKVGVKVFWKIRGPQKMKILKRLRVIYGGYEDES